jgi:hypothetical protein
MLEASPETVKRNKRKAVEYAKVLSAYRAVFKSPDGELVLKDLMDAHGILTNTFEGDVNKMLFREGGRNAVLRILHILKLDIKAIYERIDRETGSME